MADKIKPNAATAAEPKGGGSNRPPNSAFKQQKLKAFQPIFTPCKVITLFGVIGVVFLILGIILKGVTDGVVECERTRYDDSNCTGKCVVEVTCPQEMTPPTMVYYELENFFQNHRRYVKSRDDAQLRGDTPSKSQLETTCDPKVYTGEKGGPNTAVYWPSGLIAQSYFNDKFELSNGSKFTLDETNIAWESDLTYKFKNHPEYDKAVSDINQPLPPELVIGSEKVKVKWLHDVYPETIDKKKGVRDEHFVVWMRTAGLPGFRKLYGRINQKIEAGTKVQFNVTNNFKVSDFSGKKYIVLSTMSFMGGKNPFIGYAYITVGVICLLLSIGFAIKNKISPRPLGETKFLRWSEETNNSSQDPNDAQ